jgi:hypothetical protein
VLGGGHDWAGSAIRDGGLLVDLSLMRQVTVDGEEAHVAGGATVSDVLDAARPGGYAAAVGTVSSVGFAGMIAFGWDQARSVLEGWRDLTAFADDALDVVFGALYTPAGRVLHTVPTWAGDPGRAAAQIARVRALGEPVLEDVGQRALADTVHALDNVFPRGGNYRLGTRTLPGLSDAAIDSFLQAAEAMPATCALITHHSHGAATRVPVTQTAYPYRDEHLVVEMIGSWAGGDGAAESAWVQDTERRLDGHALPGGWANLMARGDGRARDAYGINTDRLLAVKSHYDPHRVFAAIPLPE